MFFLYNLWINQNTTAFIDKVWYLINKLQWFTDILVRFNTDWTKKVISNADKSAEKYIFLNYIIIAHLLTPLCVWLIVKQQWCVCNIMTERLNVLIWRVSFQCNHFRNTWNINMWESRTCCSHRPLCEVSSDRQRRLDPVVWVFDHGGPNCNFLLCRVHPADGHTVTLTCR